VLVFADKRFKQKSKQKGAKRDEIGHASHQDVDLQYYSKTEKDFNKITN